MSRILAELKIPWAFVCLVCLAVVTALAALVPQAVASDGGGGFALQPSIAATITAKSPHAAQGASIEKASAGLPARYTS